jgi:hypothetical protein
MKCCFLAACLVSILLSGSGAAVGQESAVSKPASAAQPGQARVRKFAFHYRFRVKGLEPNRTTDKNVVHVWLPCASTSEYQQVQRLAAAAPAELSETKETRYGNPLLYFETRIPASGEFAVDVPYEVTRREVLGRAISAKEKLDEIQRALYLGDNRLVPTSGKPLEMLKGAELPKDQLGLARRLYDVVDEHVAYKKDGTGWGRGDSNWVCDSGYGNCTDFHSLFMSLARSQGLPARFEIGFSIPTDQPAGPIAGYHCWAWFHTDKQGWLPVDISEADKHPSLKDYYFGNLTADRVMFSTGRDLKLVPPASREPLNFLIYPHIEVGGEVLPKENLDLQFAFENLP